MTKEFTIFSLLFQVGVAKSGCWEIDTGLVSHVPLIMISVAIYPTYNKKGLRVIIGPLSMFVSRI